MKQLTQVALSVMLSALALSQNNPAQARELIRSNQDAILNSGTEVPAVQQELGVDLKPGLYEVSEVHQTRYVKYYLLVDEYVNDPAKSLVIMFDADALAKRRGRAFFYQARPLKANGTVMLAPVMIDESGNIRVYSQARSDAPVIEISVRDGRYHYPYVLQGRNGALGGQLYGMTASGKRLPQLNSFPSTGIFASTSNGTHADVMVSGRKISLYNGSLNDQTYTLFSLNGGRGRFAGLTQSTLDTVAESELADERIQNLVTFVNGCFDRETLMLLKPTINPGEYHLETFQMAYPGFFERWFNRGRRDPAFPQY